MSVNLNLVSKYSGDGLKKASSDIKSLTGSLKGIAGAIGVGIGLSALTNGFMDAGRAAVEDVKSQALLANQLRNTIGASDSQVAGIERVIQAMQYQTNMTDDELRPALAGLVRATGDANKATQLLALSADIAAGTGKDLSTVSQAVAKAAAGQTTALFKLVPSLKGATDWAAAAKTQFAGMAETAAKADPFKQMSIIFQDLQEQIGMALLPYLQDFVGYLRSDLGQTQLKAIVDLFVQGAVAAGEFAAWLAQNHTALGALVIAIGAATVAWGIYTAAMAIMTIGTTTATVAVNALKAALISTGVGAILVVLGSIAAGFMTTGDAAASATADIQGFNAAAAQIGDAFGNQPWLNETNPLMPYNPQTKPGTSVDYFDAKTNTWYTYTYIGNGKWQKKKIEFKGDGGGGGGKAPIKNAIADYYANIADEVKKQRARLKLERMGASNALIESIIGSGEDWFKVYQDAIKGGTVGLGALQAKFNQTKAGLDEVAQAEAKLAEEAANAKAALEEQTKTFVDNQIAQREAIDATLGNVRALGSYRKEMGEFEQQATEAFASVQDSLAEAFKTGAITKDAYDNLVKYASAEGSILISIGKQRDALAAKKSLVESVIADVKDAVIGTAKLTDFVTTEAATVTQSVTQMVNGVAITTTKTTEVLKTNDNLVSGFKAILEKTRTFVTQLKELRKLGLAGDLFKQIVDAGADAGGATAAAIISGGAKTVAELNGLYKDIQTEAGNAAEITAQTLYGSGIDLTNGIIAGIQAQENALITVAQDLGTKFADAFAGRVKDAVAQALQMFQNGGAIPSVGISGGMDVSTPGLVFSGIGAGANGNFNLRPASVSAGSQVPVQVNLSLDSKVVAQQLIKLERTSGAIWVRAN